MNEIIEWNYITINNIAYYIQEVNIDKKNINAILYNEDEDLEHEFNLVLIK